MLETALGLLAWNVTLVALLAAIVVLVSLVPAIRRRPALRHSLWLLVLIKLITPPLIPVPVLADAARERTPAATEVLSPDLRSDGDLASVDVLPASDDALADPFVVSTPPIQPGDSDSGIAPTHATTSNPPPTRTTWIHSVALLAALWGIVSVALLVQLALRIRRLSRIIHLAELGSERVKRIVAAAAARMDVRDVDVREISSQLPPLVWGGWRGPTIIFPIELTKQLNDQQLTQITCHELAHHVRRDHWANTFAAFVSALFWWHPAVWLAQREMQKAQDLCADETAISSCQVTRRSYLETLLRALDLLQTDIGQSVVPANSLFEQRSLKSRFRTLSRGKLVHTNRWHTKGALLLVFAMLACIPVSAQIAPPADDAQPKNDAASPALNELPTGQGQQEEASDASAKPVTKPLFLHWLALKSSGDQITPEVILTTRVVPNRDFDVILTTTGKPPREPWIKGRITSQDGLLMRTNVQCYWRSPEEFTGPLKLDEPADASGFLWADRYFPTRLVLSYSSSPEAFLKPETRWTGEFDATSSPLRIAAIRPSNYANELTKAVGNSVGNWLSSQVYDPSNPKEQDRNRRLAKEAVARMLADDTQRIDWRLDRHAAQSEAIPIAVHKARFAMDLGDGNKWDQDVTLTYALQRPPQLHRYEIRATVSPAASDVYVEFSLPHPRDGKPDGRIGGMARVRSAYYSTGVLQVDGTWPQLFDQIKSEPLDFFETPEDTGVEP